MLLRRIGRYVGAALLVGLGACNGEFPEVGSEDALPSEAGDGTGVDNAGSVTWFAELLREGPGLCLPRSLPLTADGAVACAIGSYSFGDPECACDAPGLAPSARLRNTAVRELFDAGVCTSAGPTSCSNVCVCEVAPFEDEALAACLGDGDAELDGPGWCYVAPDQGLGGEALVADCPPASRQRLRYGNLDAVPHDGLVLSCLGGDIRPAASVPGQLPLGAPCIASDELRPEFSAFGLGDVTIDDGHPEWASGLCLVNHMQGRATCPYGQTTPEGGSEPRCFLPGSDVPVAVAVDPQLVDRRAELSSTCSCRCAGPGPGPFCRCSEGLVCDTTIVALTGNELDTTYAGGYCVPAAAAEGLPDFRYFCDSESMNCGDPRPF
jgi:hypothetical protein